MIKCIVQLFLILLFCVSVNASATDTTGQIIKGIKVEESNPFFGESFYRIFHVGPLVVYQSQYQFDSSETRLKFDSAGNQLSAVTENKRSEMRSQFFVFHRDSSYGLNYDPHRINESNRRLRVDSALLRIKGTNSFENSLTKKPDTTSWNAQRTELKEVYVQKATKDTPEVRLSLYYSNGLNSLKESLNPILDSAKKMKLYKVEYVIEEFYSEKEGRLWPPLKLSTEMKEIEVTVPEEILHYIDRYKNSSVADKQVGSTKRHEKKK